MDFFTPLNEGTTWIQAFPSSVPPATVEISNLRVHKRGLFAFPRKESVQLINAHGFTHALTLSPSHAWARQGLWSVRSLFRILRFRPQKEAERVHGFGGKELS
jgi:hypothetical protein